MNNDPNSVWSNMDDDSQDDYDDSYDIQYDDGVTIEQLAMVAGIDLEDYRRDRSD